MRSLLNLHGYRGLNRIINRGLDRWVNRHRNGFTDGRRNRFINRSRNKRLDRGGWIRLNHRSGCALAGIIDTGAAAAGTETGIGGIHGTAIVAEHRYTSIF